ncbi:hypothetical protein [Streptomyces acidiscabies]|uniref:Uncharacterized protein n=1 Tax=Streptomyces acidiscabies TaxID=42234 RepID=A0ABU4LX36_9ACTN|nr:hypothetical protein [Streptomyces acidiscabies]MDX3019992.1 hypothetical protein [Streptomyces acidiscabies]
MSPLTPLQSLTLLSIVPAVVACILWIARDQRIAVHRPDEPYDHEKHGL